MAPLHRGFSASVRTVPWAEPSRPASGWVSAELPAPPGEAPARVHAAFAGVRQPDRPARVSRSHSPAQPPSTSHSLAKADPSTSALRTQ